MLGDVLMKPVIETRGIFVFGFVISWIFGREYADHTVKDLLTLPYSRAVIVTAKFMASFIVSFLLSVYILLIGFIIGWIIGLPEWSWDVVMHSLFIIFIVTVLTILLRIPVPFFASFSRGYLAPLGFLVVALIFSQIIAAIGCGEYFPWSVPALYSGMTGEHIINLSGVIMIIITSLLGVFSTLFWWLYADQH